MERTRAYLRHHRQRVIANKIEIAKHKGWINRYAGQFAKGKVHCGCGSCVWKWHSHGPRWSDYKKLQHQQDDIIYYLEGGCDHAF